MDEIVSDWLLVYPVQDRRHSSGTPHLVAKRGLSTLLQHGSSDPESLLVTGSPCDRLVVTDGLSARLLTLNG